MSEANVQDAPKVDAQLERSTYEIICGRLEAQAGELQRRLDQLNDQRRNVFGSIETKLLKTERITTSNNCIPRDMMAIGDRFIFGYNVHIGLRSETNLEDVFSVQVYREDGFHAEPLDLLNNDQFVNDFKQLYKYYKDTTFARFFRREPYMYMVFRVGKNVTDLKAFKWMIEGGSLRYLDNRSEYEVSYPPQHDFEWTRTHRNLHRHGEHPHISIEDRVFVETVGGDLTIKIEDNTDDGTGIYSEPVDDPDQVLDDAEVFYAIVGNLILLKIRPYQENAFRYFVFNEKLQKVNRLDAIANSCVSLPEGHGLIFSNGYYLQTGENKVYENVSSQLLFERRLSASNGEDDVYVFLNPDQGLYVLLSYNMIDQHVETPIGCHGYSFTSDGKLFYFKAGDDPQKHHALQIWQTPFVDDTFTPETQTDSFLYKVGNKEIVRGMSECNEILTLIGKNETYANLYVDLVKKSGDVVDSYFWLNHQETFRLDETLIAIKETAAAAVSEFDKVTRLRGETKKQFAEVSKHADKTFIDVQSKRFDNIHDFVKCLADLRKLRGEVISLRDLRYVDTEAVGKLEETVAAHSERLSQKCVGFLLKPASLKPYEVGVQSRQSQISAIEKVANARVLESELVQAGDELEMLIDIVSNLKIDDATQRTQIIDDISAIYSNLNQARAALKKKTQELLIVEGAAEFHSQIKLISQAVVNYLDVCDTPEKCDDYLTKAMVQIEELEGRFAEFDDFVVQLTEKREEVYSAFDSRKVALVEARNKRAAALQNAADRILKGIGSRVANLDSVIDINSYFASDLMIEKVRDIVEQLTKLEDSVKVDDIQSRLKSIREDAVRQLKDRQELFVDGQNVIRFGKHQFTVNVQKLDLTSVVKDGRLYFHLTGTNFMDPIHDDRLTNLDDLWGRDVVSENKTVYRAEYLAYLYFESIESKGHIQENLELSDAQLVKRIQRFMAPRYEEGYIKGVHDNDANKIVRGLLDMRQSIGNLRYPPKARALATIFWHQYRDSPERTKWDIQLLAPRSIRSVFPNSTTTRPTIDELSHKLRQFNQRHHLVIDEMVEPALFYLQDELGERDHFSASERSIGACHGFLSHLERRHQTEMFRKSMEAVGDDVNGVCQLMTQWLSAYIAEQHADETLCIDEIVAILFDESVGHRHVVNSDTVREITGLVGSHPAVEGKTYRLDYLEFNEKLQDFADHDVPRFRQFVEAKHELIEHQREEMRLDEFKPRVLTSFVRNKLIDDVYLPMIGDNLAKQMGAAGDQKRTDLMGLLLLISPPGYGKTTLMEYVANRLGITFMKINGPAIGHQVTSLDPVEAPNASAREEVEKLNLALEMGDNVMIYVDDIQHCNPEFLQKFISLCDAQRKIEGVYKSKTRTYDLRGRKVAVVMAGNPYTESGEKFQIPDMLANRADTYNLGDVIGGKRSAFELSYLENSLTSNPTLNHLASRSTKDLYAIIQMAERDSTEGVDLEANYSVEEINELVTVMRKLMRVRDIVLRVNEQYIASAAQADAYRTEPPFKLQGSYRDMNKLAEKIVPIMNDDELEILIYSHYENSAQTLTTDAEANLLKFKEMMGNIDDEEQNRWDDIKRTFKRNVLLGGVGDDDKIGRVVAQLTSFTEGLHSINQTLANGISQSVQVPPQSDNTETQTVAVAGLDQALAAVGQFNATMTSIKESLEAGLSFGAIPTTAPAPTSVASSTPVIEMPSTIRIINRVPPAFMEVIRVQFAIIQAWMRPFENLSPKHASELSKMTQALDEAFQRYDQLINKTHSDTAQVKGEPNS